MKSIAQELGVSRMTVSFALNGTGSVSEEMRRKVVEVAERLNYKPNPNALRLNGIRPLAVAIFGLWFDLGMGAIKLRQIQSLFQERGYDAPLYGVGLSNTADAKGQAEAVAALRREKPRILVATMDGLQDEAIDQLQAYQNEGGILVTCDVENELVCDQVVFHHAQQTYLVTKHLLELGHRAIGIGFLHRVISGGRRFESYQRALHEAGIETRADWCFEGDERHDAAAAGVTIARQFLALKERPSAMAIISDGSAFSFLCELQRAGLQCPRDISVVGHDNLSLGQYFSVPLTTVTYPVDEIAATVFDFAVSRLDQSYTGPPRGADMHCQLIVRQSTRALAQL